MNFAIDQDQYTRMTGRSEMYRSGATLKQGLNKFLSLFVAGCIIALLQSCAGDSGANNEKDSDTISESVLNIASTSTSTVYEGNPAQTQEIQNFQSYFWGPLTGQGAEEDKCSRCHSLSGDAPSKFARIDDVNLAWSVASSGFAQNGNELVNLATPEDSEIVLKVAGGHQCWTASVDFCRDQLIGYIEQWRDGSVATETVVQLSAPALQEPEGSKEFPATSAEFAATVWPVLNSNSTPMHCQGCHSDSAPLTSRQTPYFASDDVDLAYEQAKSKIDLVTPVDSRFVEKLRDEFHNCWSNCTDDANDMLLAIEALANPIPVTLIDEALFKSKALRLFEDGIVASSGGRVEDDVIALYEFKEGIGSVAIDSSGVSPRADLTLTGDYEWLSAWGIQFRDGIAKADVAESGKIRDMILATGEYSIEAWVAPANVTQEGPARIISYSGGENRNFMLGQTLYNYNFPARSSNTDAQGMPMLSTADNDEDLQASLQHVVVTYNSEGRRIYVNGEFTGDDDSLAPGSLSNWNDTYALVLGGEVDGSDTWAGAIRMLAIHNRALDEQSIVTNFDADVGQKYFLLFSISHLLNSTPDAYIIFEVSQYDNYSYLFSQPYFLSLDSSVQPETFSIENMRIGINGKIAPVGQGYATLQVDVDADDYDPVTGQTLSPFGTIIQLENGPTLDQFFLLFDRIADNTEVYVEAEPTAPAPTGSGVETSQLAVRNFAEINHSFSQITGVPVTTPSIVDVFTTVEQALPPSEELTGFLASHQTAVTQMALAYCHEFVEDSALMATRGISLDPSVDPNTLSVADWNSQFIDPMISEAVNDVSEQPGTASLKEVIHHLLFTNAQVGEAGLENISLPDSPDPHGMARCSNCTSAPAAKSACAAILGSGAVTYQ